DVRPRGRLRTPLHALDAARDRRPTEVGSAGGLKRPRKDALMSTLPLLALALLLDAELQSPERDIRVNGDGGCSAVERGTIPECALGFHPAIPNSYASDNRLESTLGGGGR